MLKIFTTRDTNLGTISGESLFFVMNKKFPAFSCVKNATSLDHELGNDSARKSV